MADCLWVKNWRAFQHYKHRNPPWIKLHNTLLDDDAFLDLSLEYRGLLLLLWIVASKHDGTIPLSKRLHLTLGLPELPDLSPLITAGFLSTSNPYLLAPRLHDASNMLDRVEESRAETEHKPPTIEAAIQRNLKRFRPGNS